MDPLFNLGASLTSTESCNVAERTEPAITQRESYPAGVWACLHRQGREIPLGQTVVFSSDRSTTQ